MNLLTPKMRFRLNRWRNRWDAWTASMRQTSQSVLTEQKMCPACRALIDRNQSRCPYCGERVRVFGTGPAGKVMSRVVPRGVPVTGILLLVNFLFFILEYRLSHVSILSFKGPTNYAILRLGANLPLPVIITYHQYWRWVTAMFLHGGLLHIGFNMWALYDLGPMIEALYGRAKFLLLYTLTGVFGYMVSSAMGRFSIGASGALFGLIGVLIAYGYRNRHTMAGQQLKSMAVRWAFYALALAFMLPGVDNSAHIGGLLAGIVFGYIVPDEPPLTEGSIRFWQVVQWLTVAAIAGCFLLMARTPVQ